MDYSFDIIIPTFNRAHCLGRAIDSVLGQSFENFRVWIIDDGSTDQTEEIVSGYEDERVNYLRTENRGVSAARNFGIGHSSAPWISFLDSDDEWLPDKLEKQIQLMEKQPALKVVHGEEIWIRKGKRVNPKNKHKKFGGMIFEKCIPLCVISPSAVTIHRDVFADIGKFREDFTVCEDYDLWLRICAKYPVGFVETPIIKKYGGHSDQLSSKYHSMDVYRVRGLFSILENLEREDWIAQVCEMIEYKCKILLAGFEKHQNFRDYDEIQGILERIKNEK